MIAAALALGAVTIDHPAQRDSLTLVPLIKEGHSHVLEVRECFFDVRRKTDPERPLLRCYTRALAEIYFQDVENNRARETRFESWRQ